MIESVNMTNLRYFLILLFSCTVTKQIQPESKKVDGVTLYKQVPDTIRISGNTLIYNNWHNAKVFIYIDSVADDND